MSGALFVALLLAQPAARDDLLDLYRTANSWGMSAVRRSCADASLRPRLEGARRRLAVARRRLTATFGAEALRRNEVPMIVADDACANRPAAANAVIEFDFAVVHLETALARRRAR